jgi:hypothetical protein
MNPAIVSGPVTLIHVSCSRPSSAVRSRPPPSAANCGIRCPATSYSDRSSPSSRPPARRAERRVPRQPQHRVRRLCGQPGLDSGDGRSFSGSGCRDNRTVPGAVGSSHRQQNRASRCAAAHRCVALPGQCGRTRSESWIQPSCVLDSAGARFVGRWAARGAHHRRCRCSRSCRPPTRGSVVVGSAQRKSAAAGVSFTAARGTAQSRGTGGGLVPCRRAPLE